MVLQIWLWESSTVPDFYLRELKYSHCLSSFFLCVRVGAGWCGVWNTPFLLSCRNKSDWNKFHHFYYSNSSPPLFCKIRTVLLRFWTVPYTWASPQCMAQKSLWKAPLFRCFASFSGFLWESSTVPDFYLRELKYSHCLSSFFCVLCEWAQGGAACATRLVTVLLYC